MLMQCVHMLGSTYAYAQPVVLEIRNEVVTQYVQPVTEVMILHTITIVSNATNITSTSGINGTYRNITSTITGFTNGTMNATALANSSIAASLSPLAYNYSTGMAGTGTSTGSGFYFF